MRKKQNSKHGSESERDGALMTEIQPASSPQRSDRETEKLGEESCRRSCNGDNNVFVQKIQDDIRVARAPGSCMHYRRVSVSKPFVCLNAAKHAAMLPEERRVTAPLVPRLAPGNPCPGRLSLSFASALTRRADAWLQGSLLRTRV